MATLRATELVGAVSMLYAMLLHQDSMLSIEMQSSMIVLPQDVVNVIIATLRLFSKVCELNLEFFQVTKIILQIFSSYAGYFKSFVSLSHSPHVVTL